MDFKGWQLMDKVLFLVREDQSAYVVNPENKSQFENAKRWTGDKNENIIFDNEGFKFSLYKAAGNSSQGGKLSFWNCLIEKNNKKFVIGINANMVLDLLLNSHVINGKVQEDVIFANRSGQIGLIHKGMQQYKDALDDVEKRKQVSKKTSKHVLGRNYYTLTENNIYMGDIYKWFERVVGEYNWDFKFRILDTPVKKKIFVPYDMLSSYSSISDFLQSVLKNGSAISEWNRNIFYYLKDKLPARTEGDFQFQCNWDENSFNNYREKISEIRDTRKTYIKKALEFKFYSLFENSDMSHLEHYKDKYPDLFVRSN